MWSDLKTFEKELINYLELSIDYLEEKEFSLTALKRVALDAGIRCKSDCTEDELLDDIQRAVGVYGDDSKPYMLDTFVVPTYMARKDGLR